MTNYYIEENDKVILFDTDRQRLENTLLFQPQHEGLEIQETERPIIDFEFADTPEYLAKEFERAKGLKLIEIDAKAYEFEDKGLISYEGVTPEGEAKVVQIETTDKNIGKINGLINMFNAEIITEYLWSTKDDTPIVLHSADCYALTGLFAEFSAQIWMVKQPGYKVAVEACGTVEEVEGVLVDYSQTLAPNEESSSISTD